jgi:hypothetical protein
MAGKGDVKAEARATYGENDAAVDLKEIPVVEDAETSFAVRTPKFREEVLPIFDPASGMVIGYRTRGTVWRVYDVEGNFVTMDELPLETPWLDPIDLIGGFGGKTAMKMMSRIAGRTAAKVVIKGVSGATVSILRRVLAKLVSGSALKFTATTAAHMSTKGRFVPVHILRLANKYGARVADPQNVKGAFLYTIKMTKYVGKDAAGIAIHKEYTLEIVLREADNTILHYLYK